MSHDLAAALDAIADGRSADPFAVLGPHAIPGDEVLSVVRAFVPSATSVDLLPDLPELGQAGSVDRPALGMSRCHAGGVFEVTCEMSDAEGAYRFRITDADGTVRETGDPYRHGRVLSDYDLHLFGEGTHRHLHRAIGAHPLSLGGSAGYHFAVWAPNAVVVSVVGDFNAWDGRVHPMRNLGSSGVWELFVPGVGAGQPYKFEIRSEATGAIEQKADPFAFRSELPPRTASITRGHDEYDWGDETWIAARRAADGGRDRPMLVYEVHLGSWRRVADQGDRWLTYEELADQLVPYVRDLGYTHIELLPVMEHPFTGSWGYQVTGFFAPTSRFGTPDGFKTLVDACHRAGIGVILDWVPGHFPKDAHGLARFDGTALYEHADPRQGEHPDWGTLVFNYGRNEVRSFLLSNALYWLEEFHVDGLRVDAVASMLYLDYSRKPGEWVPNRFGGRENLEAMDFLRELNVLTHGEHPGTITMAEESTAWPGVSRPVHLGGLGFSYKWNMGWMHDMLQYVHQDPVYRRYAHQHVTFSLLYAFSENFMLPFSHDEVVHGKGSLMRRMPGDPWQKAANLRALFGFMYGHPGKKLLFMGGELGQWSEWDHDASLDWDLLEHAPHAGLQRYVRDLNRCCRQEPALHQMDFAPEGFQWIDCHDAENSVVSFVRRATDPDDHVVVVVNFTPVPRQSYRIGVPRGGVYREILNSDAASYGGGNMGNLGSVWTDAIPSHDFDQSVAVMLPPLACLMFAPEREKTDDP